MSELLPKTALRELAERKEKEFGRALIQIWPLELESMANSVARARALSKLEETVRGFIADAFDLTTASYPASEAFGLVDDEVAWLLNSLEERLLEHNLYAFRGVESPQPLRSEFQELRARVKVRLTTSLPEQRSAPKARINKGGRPGKWNWEGALIHLIAVANNPDGLPDGAGAQARIAELIADWFAANCDGATPADSEIKNRARLIMEEIGR